MFAVKTRNLTLLLAIVLCLISVGAVRGSECMEKRDSQAGSEDGCQKSTGASSRPNFILFYVDDMGYADLGCFGAPTTRTPNVDRMARQGARLTQFYTAHSICTPSRAALMTGRLPVRSGMCGNAYGSKSSGQPMVLACNAMYGLPLNETTIAESLQDSGYGTMMIGKWHLGQQLEYQPTRQGFQHYFGLPYSVDMGFAYGNDTMEKPALQTTCFPVPLIHDEKIIEQPANYMNLTARYAAEAVQYINSAAASDKPFFLYLAFSHVHVPQFAAADRIGRSERGLFGDSVEEMDSAVGAVLDAIRSHPNLASNTFAFLTSDNGAIPSVTNTVTAGNNGLLSGRKAQIWEGGLREPAVAWWPGKIAAKQVVMDVAVTTDIFATFADLAGASVPTDREMDTISMLPILNITQHSRAPSSAHTTTRSGGPMRNVSFFYQGCQLWAVRLGPWKAHFFTSPKPSFPVPHGLGPYATADWAVSEDDANDYSAVQGTPHEPPLLFNLESDPSENFPLSGHDDVLKEVEAAVATHKGALIPGRPRLPFTNQSTRLCCNMTTTPPCYCNKPS